MEGWIKIHRKLSENPLWQCEPFTRGQAWIDLILLTNHEGNFFYKRGVKIDVKRGQCGWSELALSKRWQWSRSKVRKFLKELEKEQQIIQQKNNVTQIITIINYDKYQENGQQKDTKRTPKGQQKDTNKNVKNDKNVNKIIYSNFYDSEIEKSNNDENYIKIVKILFGDNNLGFRLDSVLKLPKQLTFEQSKRIMGYKRKHNINITSLFEEMENWKGLKDKKTVYQTFLTFMKNRYKDIKL